MKLKAAWIFCIFSLLSIFITYNVIFNYILAFSTTRYKIVEKWEAKESKNPNIYVLYWTKFFQVPLWGMEKITTDADDWTFKSLNCPVTNCIFTHNKSLLSAPHLYDALVFHGAEPRLYSLPETRSPDQFYIMASME